MEHIPFLMGRPWGADHEVDDPATPTLEPLPTPSPAFVQTIAARTPHDYWLIFNECEHQLQCSTSPAEAARSYGSVLRPFLDSYVPDAKLIVGGINAHECGILWLEEFIAQYDLQFGGFPPYIAGWHFHLYPDVIPWGWMDQGIAGCDTGWSYNDIRVQSVELAWAAWQTDVHNILDFVVEYGSLVEDEIWITEMGCLNGGFHAGQLPTPQAICGQAGYMYEYTRRITNWLNTEGRWVDRYAWYTDIFGEPYQGYTRLYELTPIPPSPTPGGPPTNTPTPGNAPTLDFSALGYFYGDVTPAAATNFTNTYLPVITK